MSKKQVRAAFRKAVFERDNFQCVKCSSKPVVAELAAHHITDRNKMPNGGYVTENGITLCENCHIKAELFHAMGEAPKGFSPDDLYQTIDSSKEKALQASYNSA